MTKSELILYDPKLKSIARTLRKSMTLAEVKLWNKLRKKQLGYKFHRQRPMVGTLWIFIVPG